MREGCIRSSFCVPALLCALPDRTPISAEDAPADAKPPRVGCFRLLLPLLVLKLILMLVVLIALVLLL
jgi:hypothetical protein